MGPKACGRGSGAARSTLVHGSSTSHPTTGDIEPGEVPPGPKEDQTRVGHQPERESKVHENDVVRQTRSGTLPRAPPSEQDISRCISASGHLPGSPASSSGSRESSELSLTETARMFNELRTLLLVQDEKIEALAALINAKFQSRKGGHAVEPEAARGAMGRDTSEVDDMIASGRQARLGQTGLNAPRPVPIPIAPQRNDTPSDRLGIRPRSSVTWDTIGQPATFRDSRGGSPRIASRHPALASGHQNVSFRPEAVSRLGSVSAGMYHRNRGTQTHQYPSGIVDPLAYEPRHSPGRPPVTGYRGIPADETLLRSGLTYALTEDPVLGVVADAAEEKSLRKIIDMIDDAVGDPIEGDISAHLRWLKPKLPELYSGEDDATKFEVWLSDLLECFVALKLAGPELDTARLNAMINTTTGEAREWVYENIEDIDRDKEWTFKEAIVGLHKRFIYTNMVQAAWEQWRGEEYSLASGGVAGLYQRLKRYAGRMHDPPGEYMWKERFMTALPKSLCREVFLTHNISLYTSTFKEMYLAAQRAEQRMKDRETVEAIRSSYVHVQQ